ncbi:hypothetical protein ENKNEFLB_01430 [Nocardioides aquaticus]|uniref:Uncharacterized protein n=1 Tax=Nocardioides aquaticus TaxID=160826 RepID=A0ABX8EEY7_9ACTN|nr:hypothetical protein [Nocardioides aquaticus]QVT79050.1 hypothetical protein ENKNEFLB_01430 [Nocardioides aquaticus]
MSSRPLRCRLGYHSFHRNQRDAQGRYWCRRCGQPGHDEPFDAGKMPPGAAGGLGGV